MLMTKFEYIYIYIITLEDKHCHIKEEQPRNILISQWKAISTIFADDHLNPTMVIR